MTLLLTYKLSQNVCTSRDNIIPLMKFGGWTYDPVIAKEWDAIVGLLEKEEARGRIPFFILQLCLSTGHILNSSPMFCNDKADHQSNRRQSEPHKDAGLSWI